MPYQSQQAWRLIIERAVTVSRRWPLGAARNDKSHSGDDVRPVKGNVDTCWG